MSWGDLSPMSTGDLFPPSVNTPLVDECFLPPRTKTFWSSNEKNTISRSCAETDRAERPYTDFLRTDVRIIHLTPSAHFTRALPGGVGRSDRPLRIVCRARAIVRCVGINRAYAEVPGNGRRGSLESSAGNAHVRT